MEHTADPEAGPDSGSAEPALSNGTFAASTFSFGQAPGPLGAFGAGFGLSSTSFQNGSGQTGHFGSLGGAPPSVPTPSTISVRGGGGGGGKRSKGEVDVDDILGQITSKMNSLTTAGGEMSHDDLLTIFMEVLDVDTTQADFYLESADFNIEVAVGLCMESMQNYTFAKHSEMIARQQQQLYAKSRGVKPQQLYLPRDVEIAGLPPNWIAKVSRHTGEVYFINTETRATQKEVPPGYADLPAEAEEPSDDVHMDGQPAPQDGAAAGDAYGGACMDADADADTDANADADTSL